MIMSAGVLVWVRRAAHVGFSALILGLFSLPDVQSANVTLGWDASSDQDVAGYNIYVGVASRDYTNMIDAGMSTSLTISDLQPGVTYYFAATCYNMVGLESDFSSEALYAVPTPPPLNFAPTLNVISDLTIGQDAPMQTVQLTGISSGSPSEDQSLSVSAFSSNTELISNPTVTYVTPQPAGSLTFTPVTGAFGTSTITVMVDDGGIVSNTVIRTFAVTVTPTNTPPTLDPIGDIVLNQNSGQQVVTLSGITAGASHESQPIVVTATSSNPGLIPNPQVNYTSPNPTGTLAFTPTTNQFGTATITVVVSDGQNLNSTTSRTFNVAVNQVVATENLLTNGIVSPNQLFRVVLEAPITNGHKFNFSLDATAPSEAKIITRRNVPAFVWIPTSEYASTTNLIKIRAADTVDPTVVTNLFVQVAVRDYVSVAAGKIAVQAGGTGNLPLTLDCSEGVTNVTFLLPWSTDQFSTPSLSLASSNMTTGSIQLQGSNLMVTVRSKANQVIEGSTVVASVRFQALANAPSGFINMPVIGVTARKPNGSSYVNQVGQVGEIVLVGDRPLLRSTLRTGMSRELQLYGKTGTSYQIQFTTNTPPSGTADWSGLLTYTQTNTAQAVTVDSVPPVIFYRLRQQ